MRGRAVVGLSTVGGAMSGHKILAPFTRVLQLSEELDLRSWPTDNHGPNTSTEYDSNARFTADLHNLNAHLTPAVTQTESDANRPAAYADDASQGRNACRD
ncbi:MAG: hypothetical protein JWO80_3638 [Bryobacterales bacterium]|nr:hypothetical protein [Bryobacterales bacterium]